MFAIIIGMNILFICNGNVARSQEAEIFFNDLSKNSHAVSAGVNVNVGKPIDPMVVAVMDELGYSMKDCTRKFTDESMIDKAEMVISFKPYDELPFVLQKHANVRYWNVSDPQHQRIEFHREVRDQVKKLVGDLVQEI